MCKSFIMGCFFAFSMLVAPISQSQPQKETKPFTTQQEMVVNINTATAKEIQDILVGVGAMKSQAIVDFRQKNGKFETADALLQVKGIGSKILEKNRNRIEF